MTGQHLGLLNVDFAWVEVTFFSYSVAVVCAVEHRPIAHRRLRQNCLPALSQPGLHKKYNDPKRREMALELRKNRAHFLF